MTIKVYTTDGKAEEFPNAHIAWDWDDDENGTDSGYRIHSMDKQFTSVQAFVYPRDCKKIEILPEESDRVFSRTPRGGSITGKRFSIFASIDQERNRQDEKWGEQNHPFLGITKNFYGGDCPYPEKSVLENTLKVCRKRNKTKDLGWFDILMEEMMEAFIETDPKRQREEMVQVAAVAVHIIEYLDRKNQSTSDKQAPKGVEV